MSRTIVNTVESELKTYKEYSDNKTINSSSLIDINNTTYYIHQDWFEVVRKYFNVNSDDPNSISFLKTGLFGFNVEINANEIKNNVWHRNIIYDEHFLNTASFPESIYNFAKTYNYDIDFALPSHCRVNFSIAKEDLINNKFREEVEIETGSIVNKRITYKLELSNNTKFVLNNLVFRLPYPVVIIFKETADKTDFSLTSYYKKDNSDFPYLTLSTDYLKMWNDYIDGKKYVFIGLDLFQLDCGEYPIRINSEDISNNLFYDIAFENQLAYFEVFYTYNGETIKLNTYFNNTFQPDKNEKFCYYSIIDNKVLQISFSAVGGSFRPAFNSTILVKYYTTVGDAGNFSYVGNEINVSFSNEGMFNKVPVKVYPITECSGGRNDPTYTEVKNSIIDKFAVRDNLIIDNDLDVHFKTVNKTETVYKSSIEWIKKRNDVLKRLYTAYLTIRNRERKIIPTTTAPTLLVASEYLRANNFCIRENTRIYYNYEKNVFLIGNDNDDTESIKQNNLIYRFPFLLEIETDPILVGKYFSTYTNDEINMSYQYINPHIDDNFSLKSVSIYKDNIRDTKYTFSVSLNSTYQSISEDYLRLRLIICNENDIPYGFLELDPKKLKDATYINKFDFEGYLDINQRLIIDGNQMIFDELYDVNGGANANSLLTNVKVDNLVKFQLGIIIKSEETNYKSGLFSTMTDLDDYTTAIIYESEDLVELFINMYNYMESDVRTPTEMRKKLGEDEYQKLYGNTNYYFIKQFPLVEEIYFLNSHYDLFNIWNIYVDIVRDASDYLENNTNVDLKFVNTYGKSNYYYSSFTVDEDTNEINYDFIENVHLDIKLKLYLNYYIEEDTDINIKQYISDYIESCNDGRLFPISNLITKLETNFDIIKYIEFFLIGDDATQKIKSTFTSILDMSKDELEDYVPEYLNIQKKLDLSSKKFVEDTDSSGNKVLIEDYDYNDTLVYPYNFNINIEYVYN